MITVNTLQKMKTEGDKIAMLTCYEASFAALMNDAGVDVKLVRDKGLSHCFADQVGVTPQAEDALEEIGDFMMSHLGQRV